LDPWVIAVVAICVVAFVAITIIWGIRAHRRRISAGREELVGRTAVVTEALNPRGTVFVEGERWAAEAEEGRVKVGDEVTITRVESLKLYVSKK